MLGELAGGGALDEPADAGDEALRALLGGAEPGDYVAVLGFMAPSVEIDAAVGELRAAIRDATQLTTTFGYGPRYLHSTGQLHKGGPPSGRYLVLLQDARCTETRQAVHVRRAEDPRASATSRRSSPTPRREAAAATTAAAIRARRADR